VSAPVCAILAYPSGWYQGSIDGLLYIQANIRSKTEGDVKVLMHLPSLPALPVHGWALFDLHDGALKMENQKGILHIEVLPEGVNSHPVGPQFMHVVSPLLTNVFPLKAEYRRFADQIMFKVGPFTVHMASGNDPDFLTRHIKEGVNITKYEDK